MFWFYVFVLFLFCFCLCLFCFAQFLFFCSIFVLFFVLFFCFIFLFDVCFCFLWGRRRSCFVSVFCLFYQHKSSIRSWICMFSRFSDPSSASSACSTGRIFL